MRRRSPSSRALRSATGDLVLAATGGSLLQRVRRLLGAPSHAGRAPGWLAAGVALLVVISMSAGAVARDALTGELQEPFGRPRGAGGTAAAGAAGRVRALSCRPRCLRAARGIAAVPPSRPVSARAAMPAEPLPLPRSPIAPVPVAASPRRPPAVADRGWPAAPAALPSMAAPPPMAAAPVPVPAVVAPAPVAATPVVAQAATPRAVSRPRDRRTMARRAATTCGPTTARSSRSTIEATSSSRTTIRTSAG